MLIYLQMIETEEDRQKFTDLYETYRGLMFYVANQILHNTDDAEDAVHQAFLSIIENLDKIAKVHCPQSRAYVIVIAENKAIDMIRARKHFVDSDEKYSNAFSYYVLIVSVYLYPTFVAGLALVVLIMNARCPQQ